MSCGRRHGRDPFLERSGVRGRASAAVHLELPRAGQPGRRDLPRQRRDLCARLVRQPALEEQRRRLGDYVVSRADVDPILAPWRTRVSILATVRFHPQNILTSIPPIEIVVRDPVLGTNVPPLDASRKAIMNAGTTRPILGATIEIVFDAGLIANLNSEVIVSLRGKELVKTLIDFRSID